MVDVRPSIVICDVDGTLCDVRGIRYHVDPSQPGFSGVKDFERFHSESLNAPSHDWVVDLVREVSLAGHVVAIVTAREERWSFLTTLWLSEHGVPYDEIHFRRDGDNRADRSVKEDILAQIQSRNDVVLAIDDSPSIVSLWRENAIPTAVVGEDGLLAELGGNFGDFEEMPTRVCAFFHQRWGTH
jgi:hypothetical protein